MHISGFWSHERLTDRPISKRYPKSDMAPRVEKKSSTSRPFHAHDTWFYWSSENARHELFQAVAFESEWKRYRSPLSVEKNASVRVWIHLNSCNRCLNERSKRNNFTIHQQILSLAHSNRGDNLGLVLDFTESFKVRIRVFKSAVNVRNLLIF